MNLAYRDLCKEGVDKLQIAGVSEAVAGICLCRVRWALASWCLFASG